jgi:mannose-6-phosphate isomerase-like protein (cupin superfamily)
MMTDSSLVARPIRRIVCLDDADGKSRAIADGPSPDVRTDPARPGFAATRIWVTDRSPARMKVGGKPILETLDLPHTIEPPPGGSVCRMISFPPEADYLSKVSARDVQAYFDSMGSPGAANAGRGAPHPYMQKTRTLDFCLVIEGEITLVLDTAEVHLKAGDTVVQRGTSHAWSNRSGKPCLVAFSSHDAKA